MSNTDKDAKKKLLEEIKADYRKSKAEGEPKRAKAPRVSKYDIKRALKIATIAAMGLFGAPKMSAQNNYRVREVSLEQLMQLNGRETNNTRAYNMSSRVVRNPWEYASADAYAEDMHLYRDNRLSVGLNRIGDGVNFDGYAGVYRDMNNPNRCVILPNNMRDDFNAISEYELKDVKRMQDMGNSDGNSPYNHLDHSYHGRCACPKIGHFHGSGYICDNPTVNKIVNVIDGIGRTLHGVNHVLGGINQIAGGDGRGGSRG